MKKGWRLFSPPKNKLVEDWDGNEENRYLDSDSNKTKINYTKEPNEAQKTTLKEIMQVINENFIEMILGMVKCTGGNQEIPRQQK
jgi:DNA-binding phage protein